MAGSQNIIGGKGPGTMEDKLRDSDITSTDDTLSVCGICNIQFKNKHYLCLHMLFHTKKRHNSGNTDTDCRTKIKRFRQDGDLRKNMFTYTEDQNYICGLCQKTFTHVSSIKKHMLIHTGEKPHSCDICQRQFTRLDTLKKHMLIHTGEKTHSCNECQKQFTQAASLRKHMLTHTGEKPHPCDICQIQFTASGSLKNIC